jgi:hypothetical protein
MKAAAAAPARELYTSPLFRMSLALAVHTCDHVFVLSARHGLVELDRVLQPYNSTMRHHTARGRLDWGARVVAAIQSAIPVGYLELVMYAGADYVVPIANAALGLLVTEPMAGKQIGQRLQWLREQLAAAADRG